MKKADLMRYAEQGVRDRLTEMQAEINALAKAFPHIVRHQDGSIPAVAPVIVTKPKKVKPNGAESPQRRAFHALPKAERDRRIAKMLKARRANQRAKARAAATANGGAK